MCRFGWRFWRQDRDDLSCHLFDGLACDVDPHVLCRLARHYATEGLSGFIGKRNDLSVLNDYGCDVPMPYTTSMIC